MTYPTDYTSEDNVFDLAGELVVLTLDTGGIGETDTSATFLETSEVADLNVPTYLTFDTLDTGGNFEIVKVTNVATGGVCTIERAQNGTSALAHSGGAVAVQDPVAYHFSQLRSLLLGVEKYHGLVGSATALPATCSAGEVFIDEDNDLIYYAVATNTWRAINELDHGSLDPASLEDDDHPQYHTDDRADDWHDSLTGYTQVPVGTHITQVAHNHDGTGDDGQPVARFENGPTTGRPATPIDGQVYYDTDTGKLWIGNSAAWVEYSVLPVDTILMFEEDCPAGWTEMTAMQEKIPRGAPATQWTGFSDGGAATHIHEMADVINHVHTIQAQTGQSLQDDGGHGHSKNNHSSSSGSSVRTSAGTSSSTTKTLWHGHGTHSHSVTFPQHNTDGEGDNPAYTDSESSWPPWVSLVFCSRD